MGEQKLRPLPKQRRRRRGRGWVLTVGGGLVLTVLAEVDEVVSSPWWLVALPVVPAVCWVVWFVVCVVLDAGWDWELDRIERECPVTPATVAAWRAAHNLPPVPVRGQVEVDRRALGAVPVARRAAERWSARRRRGG